MKNWVEDKLWHSIIKYVGATGSCSNFVGNSAGSIIRSPAAAGSAAAGAAAATSLAAVRTLVAVCITARRWVTADMYHQTLSITIASSTRAYAAPTVTDQVLATEALAEKCFCSTERLIKAVLVRGVVVIDEGTPGLHRRVQAIALWRQLVRVPDKIDILRRRQRVARVFGDESEEHLVAADGGLQDLVSERAAQPFEAVHLVGKLELPLDRGDKVEVGGGREDGDAVSDLSLLKRTKEVCWKGQLVHGGRVLRGYVESAVLNPLVLFPGAKVRRSG